MQWEYIPSHHNVLGIFPTFEASGCRCLLQSCRSSPCACQHGFYAALGSLFCIRFRPRFILHVIAIIHVLDRSRHIYIRPFSQSRFSLKKALHITIIAMAALPPLSMSQTKEDLVKHLGIPAETYILMAVSFLRRHSIPK